MDEIIGVLKDVDCENCKSSADGFTSALAVWINKPHVVNRRLVGSKIDICKTVKWADLSKELLKKIVTKQGYDLNVDLWDDVKAHQNDTVELDEMDDLEVDGEAMITNRFPVESGSQIELEIKDCANDSKDFDVCDHIQNLSDSEVLVIVRQMLPKQPERHRNIPELAIIGIKNNCLIEICDIIFDDY